MIYLYAALIVTVLIILIITIKYNKLIRLKNKVKTSKSGIDIHLEQRFDLIPNLVECVKKYSKYESELLTNIVAQRSAYSLTPTFKKAEKLNLSLNEFLAVCEKYPELKANEQFSNLQKNLVKIEKQLEAARHFYNINVEKYNSAIQIVPNNIVAKIFGFKEFEFFQIDDFKKENIEVKGGN